jgi:hypothetical protein
MSWKTTRVALGALLGLSAGQAVSAKELWVPPAHSSDPAVHFFPWPATAAGVASFAFAVPDDFNAFMSATIAVLPRSDFDGTFDVYGSVRREGESAIGSAFHDLGMPAILTAGEIAEIDVSALLNGRLDPSSAGTDYVSFFFRFPEAPALQRGHIVGLRFVYEPIPVTGAEIEDGTITQPKLAPSSVGTLQVRDQNLTGIDIKDASIGAADVNLAQIQARVAGSCPAGQSIRAIGMGGTVTCEPTAASVPDFVLWVNPLSMIPDEDGSGDTSLLLSRGAAGTTLRVRTSETGDLQWLNLPLALDSRFAIKGVTLCYDLSSASSFISQVRITEETLPPTAAIRHDDGTDLTSVVSACVDSPVGNLEPEGAMTLALRLNFASTAHTIDIGAVGIRLGK